MSLRPGKNLYLFLAMACFLGIVLIFFFDGYVGVYDSLKADDGSYLQEVPTEIWQNPDQFRAPFSLTIGEVGSLKFTYRVDNHRFTGYTAPVVVTLEDTTGTVTELAHRTLTAGAFGNGEITWTLNGADLVPAGAAGSTLAVEMTIQRDGVTRQISLYVNRNGLVPKVVPPAATE